MTYFLNRVILRLHGGKSETQSIREGSWGFVRRMLAAKELGHLSGITGYRYFRRPTDVGRDSSFTNFGRRLSFRKNQQFIVALEKKLRYLEKHGAIIIHNGKIFCSGRPINFPEEGGGMVEPIKTIGQAIAVVCQELGDDRPAQLLQADIERRIEKLFVKAESSPPLPMPNNLSRMERLAVFFVNPILHLKAIDAAAHSRISKIKERTAQSARQDIIKDHPHTKSNIELLERAMDQARRQSLSAIHRCFNPQYFEPFQLPVVPTESFTLRGLNPPGQPEFAAVVSDLHLSEKQHPRTDDFLRFLSVVVTMGMSLVGNGDIYDLFRYQQERETIGASNPWISHAFQRLPRFLLIPGNHDRALKKITKPFGKLGPNIYVPAIGTHYENHVYFEHGHQADRHNQDKTNRGYYIIKFLSYLEQSPIASFIFPNLMEWLEAGERAWFSLKTQLAKAYWFLPNLFTGEKVEVKDKWKEYKIEAVVKRIRQVVRALENDGEVFTPENPLLYVRGHDHGLGYWYTINDVVDAVKNDPQLHRKVRYCSTGSWQGDEAHVLFIDYSQPDRVYAYPFQWPTIYEPFIVFKEQT